MLIFTTNLLGPDRDVGAEPAWGGPKVLLVQPGSGLTRERIDRLSGSAVVIEYLQPATTTASMLGDVVGWMRPTLDQAEWPLLYLDRPGDAAFLAEQEAAGRDRPDDLEAELSEGRLVLLRLGEMIASSPLLPEFFQFLRDRSIDDATLVTLLDGAFPRTQA